MRDRSLDRPHQNVGVFFVVDRNLAHHHRGWLDLNIAVEDRKDLAMPFGLIPDELSDRKSDRSV